MNRREQLVHDYAQKQQRIVDSVVADLDDSVDEFSFKQEIPPEITIDGASWTLKPHGVGILFKNSSTGEVVDAHVGFLDASDAFDAWRLEQYEESIGLCDQDNPSWGDTLDSMAKQQAIVPHSKYPHHFVLA